MYSKFLSASVAGLMALSLAACGEEQQAVGTNPLPADASQPTEAAPATIAHNRAVADMLPLADQDDFEAARQGFIGTTENLFVTGTAGQKVWSVEDYAYQNNAEAPDSVNPSLWRQAQLNNINGLFKVGDGIYQVRGFDLANMSVIEGKTGWILVDPLTAESTARAALALVNELLGERPVTGVLFTHSHIDHFGGINGVLTQAEQAERNVPVVAPEGFVEESVSENVVAGPVMMRRASYMYGMALPRNDKGHVDTGLGKQPATGMPSIMQPTQIVDHSGQTLVIDGVTFEFMHTPAAEAPAEFMFYLPEKRAFCGAEIISHNFHNLYTLRGAKVRDALKWARYIDDALVEYGSKSDVIFNSHHWPVFGQDKVKTYLKGQRDIYKFTHDQTMRLANQGLTPNEIAATIKLPEALQNNFATRDYYGTLKHNAKAVYQFYFGWYDGNPVNLDPLPPAEQGARYVEAMGGADAVLDKARAAYGAGDFQWAARLAHHVVFADPTNIDGRLMLAQSYDQLGYMAESGPWRDAYLSGAYELRNGLPQLDVLGMGAGLIGSIPLELFFVAMGTNLDPEKAGDKAITVNLVVPDKGEAYTLMLENAVLNYRTGAAADADATLSITHTLLLKVLLGGAGIADLVGGDDVSVDGSLIKLGQFFASFSAPKPGAFPITTP